jgi:hypothetical protein
MANTSSGKEKDKKSKRKLKDKDKKAAVALLDGAGSKPPKVGFCHLDNINPRGPSQQMTETYLWRLAACTI